MRSAVPGATSQRFAFTNLDEVLGDSPFTLRVEILRRRTLVRPARSPGLNKIGTCAEVLTPDIVA